MECKTDGQTRELKAARCPQNNQILRIKTVHDYIKRMQWHTVFVYPVFVYTYLAQKNWHKYLPFLFGDSDNGLFFHLGCDSTIQYTGLGIGSSFLPKKVNKWAIPSKVSVSLIFGERPERFAHNYSFLLSDLNKLLKVAYLSWPTWAIRSLGSEGMRESFAFLKSFLKNCKNIQKYDFFVFFSTNCSFLWAKEQMSDSLKKKKWFTHLLIYYEWPELITHIHSFVLSDLSEWANEQWVNELIPNPGTAVFMWLFIVLESSSISIYLLSHKWALSWSQNYKWQNGKECKGKTIYAQSALEWRVRKIS